MWYGTPCRCGGHLRFFYLILGNVSLATYYKTNFGFKEHHGWNLLELEKMIPWEREIYVTLLLQYLKELEDKRKQERAANGQ